LEIATNAAALMSGDFWDETGGIWWDMDGVIHIRNSERGSLGKCPQRWWWDWREGLRLKETPKALWFGTAIHEALADYYRPGTKRSKDFIDKFRESADMEEEYIRANVGDIDEDQWVDARTLGEQMLTGYHKYWGGDKKWDVIATEQTFSVKIPLVAPGGSNRFNRRMIDKILAKYGEFFIIDGTWDGVYYDKADKRFKLMEHKTAGSISLGHLPMDNQAGTYWLVAGSAGVSQGWLPKDKGISEITYNFLRKGMPDPRPQDAEGYARNLPTKTHYIAALEELGVHQIMGSGKTKEVVLEKATVADLKTACAFAGIEVLGERSKRQPPPLYLRHPVRKTKPQRRQQLARIQADLWRMILIVEGVEPLNKTSGRDTCPMCPFKDMCELHESGAGWMEFRDAMYRGTDPYADHRKDAAL
jgi:hypothetical protein